MEDKRRIVLLDDDDRQLSLYREELSFRFDVVAIQLGSRREVDVITQIAKLDPRPVAILLDVFKGNPSNGNPPETFRALLSGLRERFGGRVQLIAITRWIKDTDTKLVIDWYRNGVSDWIWKDPRKILRVVHDVEMAIESHSASRNPGARRPKIAISHGGSTPDDVSALEKVRRMVEALGMEPVVVESMASGGLSINELVRRRVGESDAGVVLATRDRAGANPNVTRGNVLHEYGIFQEQLGRRIVVLVEEDCDLPSNVREFPHERFTPNNMENAFIKMVREFREFGLVAV